MSPVLATSLIRRENEDYHGFTLIVSREQQNEQNPSLAKRAHQTLDKTGIFSPNHRHTFRYDSQPFRFDCRKCIVAPAIDRIKSPD